MTLQEFLNRVNYELRGTDDDAPTVGDEDANYWGSELNAVKTNWARDPNQKWDSLFVPDTEIEDAITDAAKPSWNIPTTFIMPSDKVEILLSDGTTLYEYDLTKGSERDRYNMKFYIAGRNPQKLYCSTAILTTDTIIGGKLYLPGYYEPADVDLEDADAIVPIDDPEYAVMAVAAKVAFADITYEDKYNDLNGQANVLYRQMTARNRRGTSSRPRKTPTRIPFVKGNYKS